MEYELKVQASFNNHILSINKKVSIGSLESVLDKYITYFVLCKKCSYPDTRLKKSLDESLAIDCKKCGACENIVGNKGMQMFILNHFEKIVFKSSKKHLILKHGPNITIPDDIEDYA